MHQLAKAISLRTLDITNQQFKRQAAKIKNAIINIINRQAKRPAIWKIQDIFREKAERLYHWADDRNVSADHNPAERELRPLVTAGRLSFVSQSDAGAKSREILMTILHTLKKRKTDVTSAFNSALDNLAEQADIDLYKAVFKFEWLRQQMRSS
jgi:transposase